MPPGYTHDFRLARGQRRVRCARAGARTRYADPSSCERKCIHRAAADDDAFEPKRRAAKEARRLAQREALRPIVLAVLPPVLGFALFIGIWTLVSQTSPELPAPIKVWHSAAQLFADPFYRKGPNDQGIGWNILNSLQRVGLGFGVAAVIGIPLGFILGRFAFLNAMAAPVISRAPSLRCVVADRSPGVQGRQPGRDLGLHLQHLADDHQHRRRRAACRGLFNVAGPQSVRVEVMTRSCSGHAAVRSPAFGFPSASHGSSSSPLKCSRAAPASASGSGTMEQSQRRAHHHRDLRRRDRRAPARTAVAAARATLRLRVRERT